MSIEDWKQVRSFNKATSTMTVLIRGGMILYGCLRRPSTSQPPTRNTQHIDSIGDQSMRSMHKIWRNGPGGKWTFRAKWYGEGKDCQENIRLNFHCPVGEMNVYPASKGVADRLWQQFKDLVGAGDMSAVWDFIEGEF